MYIYMAKNESAVKYECFFLFVKGRKTESDLYLLEYTSTTPGGIRI